jgi:hypothetical protein
MPSLSEACRQLLAAPCEYLHPQRLQLAGELDQPAVRAVLDPLLVRGLPVKLVAGPEAFDPGWQALWIEHWRRLPSVASLMGAYLEYGDLARGAASLQLNDAQRAFAQYALGERRALAWAPGVTVAQRIAAHGLGVLSSWQGQVSGSLLAALALQFSPEVARLAAGLPLQPPRPLLFSLAVQHARLHSNPA